MPSGVSSRAHLLEADVAVGLGDDAVKDHEVEGEGGVRAAPKGVEEGDGADLGVGSGADEGGGVREEGAEAFGDGEYPPATGRGGRT
jgi:hypothetical protein